MSAFLLDKYSINDLVTGVQLFQLTNPLSLKDKDIPDRRNIVTPSLYTSDKISVLCGPLVSPWATLDTIFVDTIALKRKAERLLDNGTNTTIEDLRLLMEEAELLKGEYQKCAFDLSPEWSSSMLGFIPSGNSPTR